MKYQIDYITLDGVEHTMFTDKFELNDGMVSFYLDEEMEIILPTSSVNIYYDKKSRFGKKEG